MAKDKLLNDYITINSLKILKKGLEQINQDKVLEQYYSMEYVKKLKKRDDTK